MDKITKILLNYTSGKTTLEETNHALEDAGSDIRLNPAKNLFTPEELLATHTGETPEEALLRQAGFSNVERLLREGNTTLLRAERD